MGIGQEAYKALLDEKKRGNLEGESILQLGRQCILFDQKMLKKIAQKNGVNLLDVPLELSFDNYWKERNFIDDKMFFKALGFKDVQSLDYSDFEGSEIIHDLNKRIPEKYWNRFDVIIDGGTTEHIFHIPQLLENLHLLLKEGGVIIHNTPSNNHVDHGFYMLCPQILNEYYRANQYEILTSQIYEYMAGPKKWIFYNYEPGVLDELSIGGFKKKLLGINIVVRKGANSTGGVIPQQGSYVRSWNPEKRTPTRRRKVNPIHRLCISWNKKLKRRFHGWRLFLARRQLAKLRCK